MAPSKPLVLLTGGTGFIGKHVLNALLEAGFSVRLTTRNKPPPEILQNKLINKIFITPNLFQESEGWLEKICENVDVIVHLAWYVKPQDYLHSPVNLECAIGTLKFAKSAAKMGVNKFIGIGTSFEYKLGNVMDITTPLEPTTPYSSAKAAIYLALKDWLPLNGVDFTWCRLFDIYGEGENENRLVSYLHKQLKNNLVAELSSGKQIRDYINAKEIGCSIVKIITNNISGPINICSGIPISIRELAERIASSYNKIDLLKFGARQDNLIDPPVIVGIKTNLDVRQ